MMAFRRAARAALERWYAGVPGRSAPIERMSLEVALDEQRHSVALTMRAGELSWSCTCGHATCAHAQTALAWVGEADTHGHHERITEIWEPTVGPGDRRIVAQSISPAQVDGAGLAEVLRDLIMALVRSGVAGGQSPSIDDALQRLQRAAPAPLPLGVSRFIGRLKQALAERDSDEAALLLETASRLLDDLSSGNPAPDARRRVLSWLGARSSDRTGPTRLSDLSLIEIAREKLLGVERAGLERRYLADPADGAIYREERGPSTQTASIGPCPRAITVWLAEMDETAPPKRVRLLQYAVAPSVEPEVWEQLGSHAARDFAALLDAYRDALRSCSSLSEPVVLVAPKSVVAESSPALVDERERLLPLLCPGRPALPGFFRSQTLGAELLWVAGRLLDRGGLVGIWPLAALLRRRGRLCYVQT
jgi:hypothetical protein